MSTAASTTASEPWNADEIIEPLADEDVFEFNFLTFVEDEITPEDIMEYQHISENREHCFLVETLSENRKWYTLREFRNAKRARELCHNSGYMTVEDFKRILRQPNMIENCPVTVQDVVIAEDLFGPDMSYWKGIRTPARSLNPLNTPLLQFHLRSSKGART